MNEAVREMTFDEEYKILTEEKKELFEREIEGCEPPFANCVVRRALRCIRKLMKEKNEEIQQYRPIGTVDQLREAMEYRNPVTPKLESQYYICPRCGSRKNIMLRSKFCSECGQAFRWEEQK